MRYDIKSIKGFSCPKKYLILIDNKPFLFFNNEVQASQAITILNGHEIDPELENLSKFVKSSHIKWKKDV